MIATLLTLLTTLAAIMCLAMPPTALADDGDAADTGDASSQTQTATSGAGAITDIDNLLGGDLTHVSDRIDEVKEKTGVSVRLMYLPTFGEIDDSDQWAKSVLEALSPEKNTVMLAVASNDGKMVVAVSSNSDEWLRRKTTVDALSDAAAGPLQGATADWSGAADAMMDELVRQKQTSTSSSSVTVGIAVMGGVLVVLVVVVGATAFVRHRGAHSGDAVKRSAKARTKGGAKSGSKSGGTNRDDGPASDADDASDASGGTDAAPTVSAEETAQFEAFLKASAEQESGHPVDDRGRPLTRRELRRLREAESGRKGR
ncbi:TPM domain-containing protein [Bifidobacterium samirii]|nr:TPM domain-containing protein [Bifidobacterium samirii]